ncbi:MAG: orotate phosphoribosyltransferase [Candidatus Omnitrophota bacterium]
MKKELLKLIKKDAFFKKKVILSSGKTSNFYIDIRKISLTPQGIYLISHLFYDIIENGSITAIGGPTLGADPIVSGVCFVAYEKKMPLKGFLIRKNPKKHGSQRMIEGHALKRTDKVVIVDDVATSGGSLVKSIEVLRNEGIKVVKALTVIDRGEGAKVALAKLDCPLISLFNRSDFST